MPGVEFLGLHGKDSNDGRISTMHEIKKGGKVDM